MPMDHLLGGYEKLQKKLERARSGDSTGRSSNALATFELTRPLVGASALGIAQAAYEWTLEYLADKEEDGQPLLQQQRIQQALADVATEIESARLLVWRAAWMGRNGIPMTAGQGSMSKLKAGDVAMWATTTLMDLVGPFAQTTDCPLEKWFRDAKIYQIFEGTAQMQRLVIARMQVADAQSRAESALPRRGQRRLGGCREPRPPRPSRRRARFGRARSTGRRTLAGVRPARLTAAMLALAVLAGCDSDSPDPVPMRPDPLHSYDGRVIRGWLLALDRQDYGQAAYYFAPNALIDQGNGPIRLRTQDEAFAFNASLPCRADLIRLKGGGAHVLATFRAAGGAGRRLQRPVKVRYTIRNGKFSAWRQLPNIRRGPAPPQSAAALPGGCPGAAAPRAHAASRPASRPRSAAPRWACPRRPGRPS